MAKAILLTGLKKVGKTTTIKKIVELIGSERCGGFYTEEILKDPTDIYSRIGFRFRTIDGKEGVLASVDSESNLRVGSVKAGGLEKYGVELEAFEEICVRAIFDALENREFVVIDEIGHMQLFSNKFKQAVKKVMESDKTLIGTIVSGPNFWADWFKEEYQYDDSNKVTGVAEIYHMTHGNRDNLSEMLLWLVRRKFSHQ